MASWDRQTLVSKFFWKENSRVCCLCRYLRWKEADRNAAAEHGCNWYRSLGSSNLLLAKILKISLGLWKLSLQIVLVCFVRKLLLFDHLFYFLLCNLFLLVLHKHWKWRRILGWYLYKGDLVTFHITQDDWVMVTMVTFY